MPGCDGEPLVECGKFMMLEAKERETRFETTLKANGIQVLNEKERRRGQGLLFNR